MRLILNKKKCWNEEADKKLGKLFQNSLVNDRKFIIKHISGKILQYERLNNKIEEPSLKLTDKFKLEYFQIKTNIFKSHNLATFKIIPFCLVFSFDQNQLFLFILTRIHTYLDTDDKLR